MKTRTAYIDATRAILIFLVVLGHVLNYADPEYKVIPYILAREFINSFHMPAFFVLSGTLTDIEKWRARPWTTYILHKAKTLLVPYLFFEVLAILYKHFILHSVSLLDGIYRMVTMRCNIGADWFLPAMFLACLIFYLYIRYSNQLLWCVAAVLALAALPHFPSGHGWTLLFRGVLGFVFMLAGSLLKKQLLDVKWWKIFGTFLITAVAAAVCFKLSLGNSFFDGVLKSPILFLISGICGLYFVMGIARWLHWTWLSRIGENSLTIMGTHQLVLYTVPGNASVLWVGGMLLLVAAVEAVLIVVINRFCPYLVGKSRKENV